MTPSIVEQRAALRAASFEASAKYRILFVGRFTYGQTDVVASLLRALEALGHTVFHIDTDRHDDVLHNPNDASGGFGPVFLQMAKLRTVLDVFQPEWIILCGGGLVLDEGDVDELRARGVATLGMTLSDPDVQATIIDHVARFDYHTTNSGLALDGYRAAGLTNGFQMPFATDRDFILREVPRDPSLEADVIAIGHASGRPDRHAVMTALAGEFHTRVYGEGWPLAGAEPIAGDRLLQAARAGTFHVSFSTSRAGHSNVNGGVFESIGSGGVVCTSRFDEMSELFEYGSEIIGYDDAHELVSTLRTLLGQPEEIERIRRRAFDRLVREHLYEHRWKALFTSIEADVNAAGPRVGISRAGEISEILARTHQRPHRVLLSGFFGARNRGDDMLLESLASPIEELVPDSHVAVAAVNPRQIELGHGRPAFNRADPHESDYWASRATSLILGPGGLWHDYTIHQAGGVAGIIDGATVSPSHLAQLPVLVRAHGGDVHVFGMGVGPLTDPAAQSAIRLTGFLADSVVVRDIESAELLDRIEGWPTTVEVAPDVAFAMRLPKRTDVRSGGYLAVNVRPWPTIDGERLLDLLWEASTARGLRLVVVPMQPVDESLMRAWIDSKPNLHDVELMSSDASHREFAGVLGGASAVVAMRLHTSLIAHRLERPVVGIAYDPKVKAHFEALGRGDFSLTPPLDEEALISLVDRALGDVRLPKDIVEHVAEQEAAAHLAIERLCGALRRRATRLAPPGGFVVRSNVPDEHPLPLGWSREHVLNLAKAQVIGGNLHDGERRVPVSRGSPGSGDRFWLTESAPRLGDYAAWTLPLHVEPGRGVRVELWISHAYRERPAGLGRIAYQVLVGGQLLFEMDVAAWAQRNTVWLAFVPESGTENVEVRIVANRDCEPSQWGPATAVTVEAARALAWDDCQDLAWGASSPYVTTRPLDDIADDSDQADSNADELVEDDPPLHITSGPPMWAWIRRSLDRLVGVRPR